MLSSLRAFLAARPCPHPRARWFAEAAIAALAAATLVWAWHADFSWCERHVIMPYWQHDAMARVIARNWRIAAIAMGVSLLAFVRPLAGQWAGRCGARQAISAQGRMLLAVALALVASEGALRAAHAKRPARAPAVHSLCIPDERYGWAWQPSRSAVLAETGRPVEYAINADGNRARSVDEVTDPSLPTLLFTGESIAEGHGLPWDETCPALVGQTLGLQVVSLGTRAYGTDQAFLRLADSLPRFAHPVAVVTFFMPTMLWRMTNEDHPHLAFEGHAPTLSTDADFWRELELARLWREVVRYDSDAPIVLGAEIVRETARLGREHGAKVLFVRPYFDIQSDEDLLAELFRKQGVSVVGVTVGRDLLANDGHPNAISTRRMADAVVAALRTEPPS